MSRTPTPGIDYTSRDYEGFRQMMLQELGIKMPEYTDHSQTDAGIVIMELLSKGLDIISYYTDVMANETLLTTCRRRENANLWCDILSYVPRNATPSRVMQVFKLTGVQTENVVIPAMTQVKTRQSATEEEIVFETEEPLTIPAGKLGNETDENGKYLYQVSAVQGITVEGEIVGGSNGTPNQSFQLSYPSVINDSVVIEVNEGSGFEYWTRVTNFVESGPEDRHFVLKVTNDNYTSVVFGDGVTGKIPARFDNGIRAAFYRVGGGTKGNVGANKVNLLESSLALVDSTFNPEEAYEKGYDRETVDEIKINAPRYGETKWGALTLKDFAGVVLYNFPQVVYANSERDTEDIDDIHIYLLTDEGAVINDSLMSELTAFFDENDGGRKIVGADEIIIEPASLVPVGLEANLIVKDRYSRSAVSAQIRELIEDYFAVGNYPFNQELSLSELAAYVMNPDNAILGIKSFYFISPEEPVLTPTAKQIFTLGELTIEAGGGVA